MNTSEFTSFTGALVAFDASIESIVDGYTRELGSQVISEIIQLPTIRKDVIKQVVDSSTMRYGSRTLREYYTDANAHLGTITKFLPELRHGRTIDGTRVYRYDTSDRKVRADNIYNLFRTTLEEKLVALPEEFMTAYETLTTGTWRGRTLHEDDTSQPSPTPFVPAEWVSRYIVSVPKGSKLDDAFAFFSALGFFKKQESGEGNVQYLLGNRRVSLERASGGDYSSYSRNSVFRQYCTDQALLETLQSARRK